MSERSAMWCGLALAALTATNATGQDAYKKPPQAVLDILHAPSSPAVSVSPSGEHLLFVQSDRYPPIADLAEPTLRLTRRQFVHNRIHPTLPHQVDPPHVTRPSFGERSARHRCREHVRQRMDEIQNRDERREVMRYTVQLVSAPSPRNAFRDAL